MEVKPLRQGSVPAGHKQTEVGVIPEEWEVKTVKSLNFDISDGNYSSKYPKVSDFRPIGVPFIRANNVRDMDVVDDDMRFISSDQHRELQKGHLKKNDILVTTRGEIGQIALVPDRHVDSNINAQIVRINTDNHGVDHRFFAYSMGSKSSQAQLNNLQTGSALKQLPVGKLVQLQIVIPSLPEQRAIAGALSDVDALIGALDQLIAKKRDLKQAAMQQLLTGHQRLPGFHGEWEEKTLGEIGQCIIGLTYKPENVVKHGLLVLRASNIQNGQLAYDDNVYVNLEVPEHLVTRPGDILICVRNGSRALIGKCAMIDETAVGVTFGAFMSVYRTKHSRFVFHAFQGHDIQRQIHENIGATINQITNKDLKAFRVKLPPEDEQTAIAEVLSDMDAELAALEQRRDKTRALKQGMMQELLTGRTRLVDKRRGDE